MSGDGATRPKQPSWPVATWTAPLAPVLVLWGALLSAALLDRAGLAGPDTEPGLAVLGLVVALLLAGAGGLATRASAPWLRGLGLGLAAGGGACAAVLLLPVSVP